MAGFWVCPGEQGLYSGPHQPPDPPDTPCSLPQALLGVMPPSCARCQPPSHWEGSAPFIASSCPFSLSALSFIFCKSSLGPSCTGEGLGALSWETDFPGSSADDSRCLWKKKKKKVLLFILRLLTAILCNICCFLFQGGVCELSWEMMISGVDGV